jgi:hypothetical protein
MARTFYRIVRASERRGEDFLSDAARGEPPPLDPAQVRLHEGISVFNTERQARNKAEAYPALGEYIAAIDLPDDAPVRYERTLRTRGHYTLWGDPIYLADRVISIRPVEPL